jgi:hypothetical protein
MKANAYVIQIQFHMKAEVQDNLIYKGIQTIIPKKKHNSVPPNGRITIKRAARNTRFMLSSARILDKDRKTAREQRCFQ